MNYLCRLCSSTEKIFDVYHPQLENGDQLRHYILLASGIKILWNDPISRMVCQSCCEIAIKLNKYRSIAIANDKLLKERFGQPYTPPITDKDELLSAASRIFNINDVSIIKDDTTDPLELLNAYIKSRVTKLEKINGETTLNNTKIANEVSNESNGILKDTVTTSPKILIVGSANGVHPENGVTHFNNVKCSPSEDKQTAISKDTFSNDGNGEKVSKQLLPSGLTGDISKTITPCSALTNNHNEVDNAKDHEESVKIISKKNSAQTSFSSPVDIYTHPSVKKLYQEYNSIQIPREVYSSDVSPLISLDPNEVSDWYAQQLQMLKDKLKNVSNSNTLTSSDGEEHFSPRPRRRKRKYKRVINSSDSDDDEEWLPFKMQAQDGKSTKPSRAAVNPSSAITPTTVATVATTQNNVPVSCNYAVVNGTGLAPQQGNSGLKLKIMKYPSLPAATITAPDAFLVTQPNTRVLQSLLTSNDQTLANLYTDFSKYGINIENSDPPIQYENVIDSGGTSSLTDMVLEAMVLQKPAELAQKPAEPTQKPAAPTLKPIAPKPNPVKSTQKPPEASVIQDKINDEIICISDDDNDNIGKSSVDSCNFMNSNEDEMVQLLFRKHLSKKLHKDTQTFHPTDALIHRTKTNLIAVPNMVGELKRYKIPIDLQYSTTNVAHFENIARHRPNVTMDKWLREECVDISNLQNVPPIPLNINIGLPNVIKSKPIPSTLWHQTFVERLNNTMKNNQSTLPSTSTIVTNTTIPITTPITTLQSNMVKQTTSNIIQTSAAVSSCDKDIIPITVSNINHESTAPLILNGANSLSLRSLLFPTKNIIEKPQETTSSTATNTFVNSPLLHTYLQTNKTVTPKSIAVFSSSNEQLEKRCDDVSPIVIDDTEDTVTQSVVPSKIRVKSLAELKEKV